MRYFTNLPIKLLPNNIFTNMFVKVVITRFKILKFNSCGWVALKIVGFKRRLNWQWLYGSSYVAVWYVFPSWWSLELTCIRTILSTCVHTGRMSPSALLFRSCARSTTSWHTSTPWCGWCIFCCIAVTCNNSLWSYSYMRCVLNGLKLVSCITWCFMCIL